MPKKQKKNFFTSNLVVLSIYNFIVVLLLQSIFPKEKETKETFSKQILEDISQINRCFLRIVVLSILNPLRYVFWKYVNFFNNVHQTK